MRALLGVRLQFGHGSSAVETRAKPGTTPRRTRFNSATALQPWKPDRSVPAHRAAGTLQFGHGSSAVETWAGALPIGARRCSFNSATALQPWKPRTAQKCSVPYHVASIRPRLFSRGNPVPTKLSSSVVIRFNSATALQPWKLPANYREPPDQAHRFNSATALQPWKRQLRSARRDACARASIRPRLFSRGNGR